jgi:type I restriction enzyme S subunit
MRRDRVISSSLKPVEASGQSHLTSQMAARRIGCAAELACRAVHVDELRETALDLAVTGRLTAQVPNDGTADLLLATRPRRRLGIPDPVDAEDGSYSVPTLPHSWRWVVVDQLASADATAITDGPFGANLKTEHYVDAAGFRVIRLQNIGRRVFRDEHRSYITAAHFERLSRHHVVAGDLVVAGLVDPYVRCCEVPAIGPALVKADCYRFAVHPNVSSRFVMYYLNSRTAQRFAAAHHHGMTLIRIGLGNFRRLPVPLPPLAEQHRIVAQLEELLSLCEGLERRIASGETASSRLLDALLHEALASPHRSRAEQTVS